MTLEGTDASGKATQLGRLKERFRQEGLPLKEWSFPTYDTPSGRIIAGPVLGKPGYGESYFEKPSVEDARAISMYYAANRRFELPGINEALENGFHVALDRYRDSNKACQGGKILELEKRLEIYRDLDLLEHDFAKLPNADLTVLLYMPFKIGQILKGGMDEGKDEVEKDKVYLRNQETAYSELAELGAWPMIRCFPDDKISVVKDKEDVEKYIKSVDDVHEEVWGHVRKILAV